METVHPIVLFDGVCNYCNSWVNFAIKHDKRAKLRFTPLQSETGQRIRQQLGLGDKTDSVIFVDGKKAYTYSDAALKIALSLDWPAKMLYALKLVPRFLRQPIYKWIAKNRYKWFGKKESCMIPTPDISNRFIP